MKDPGLDLAKMAANLLHDEEREIVELEEVLRQKFGDTTRAGRPRSCTQERI